MFRMPMPRAWECKGGPRQKKSDSNGYLLDLREDVKACQYD